MFFLIEYLNVSYIISVENGYQIYIGGNGGTEVTVGQLLTTVETEDQVVQLCGALMQY
jgi:nitrite reductase (NADH) large subunit